MPCLGELNDVLKNPDIDVEMALDKNIAIMQKIVPYFEDMLSDEATTQIDDEERAVLGNYRQSVLA